MAKNLIVQTAFLGDIILTTPLIKAVKTVFKDDELLVLTTEQGTEILEGIEEIDGFILYDKRNYHQGLSAFFKVINVLKRGNFNRAIAVQESYRTSLMLYLARIPERIGYDTAGFSSLYNTKVHFDNKKHAVERYLGMLSAFSENPDKFTKEPFLAVNVNSGAKLFKSLQVAGIDMEEKFAVVCPGSVWPTKEWPPERYAMLIDRLHRDQGIKTVLAGGRSEKDLANEIQNICSSSVINWVAKTSLARLVALIDRCSILT